jgi:hypothetical protein
MKILKNTLLIIAIIYLSLSIYIMYDYTFNNNFVSSEYSKYCYSKDNINKNIKHRIYYKTLENCGKPLKI